MKSTPTHCDAGSALRSLLATLSLTLGAHGAGTLVIIEDNFTRTGALVGSNADTGQTWTGSSTFLTTGTAYQVNGSAPSFARIGGITFDPSSTYCLEVDVNMFFPFSDGRLGLGFSSSTSTDPFTDTIGTFLRREDPVVETYTVGAAGNINYPATDPFPDQLTIVLDTGATLASSTLTWQLNGSTIRTESVDATGIDGIFLASDATDVQLRGEFDRLRLTGPIPEPSTAMLLALAALGITTRRRR